MAIYDNPKIVTNGLVLCLDAGNRKSYPGSGTAWTDLSGLGNNGTLTNGPTFNANNAGSIVFDGTNDQVETSFMPPVGQSPRTICMWVNPTIAQNKNLLGYGSNVSRQLWDILMYQGNIGVHLYGTAATAGISHTIGSWQHIVFAYSHPTIQSYGNGIAVSSYSDVNINTGTDNTLYIGTGVYYNAYKNCAAAITNVQIYNRALSAAEVEQNFNATRKRFGI